MSANVATSAALLLSTNSLAGFFVWYDCADAGRARRCVAPALGWPDIGPATVAVAVRKPARDSCSPCSRPCGWCSASLCRMLLMVSFKAVALNERPVTTGRWLDRSSLWASTVFWKRFIALPNSSNSDLGRPPNAIVA